MRRFILFPGVRRWFAGVSVLAALWSIGAPAIGQPPQPPPPTPQRQARSGDVIAIGETIYLRADSGRNIKEVVSSRPNVLHIRTLDDKRANVVMATGINVGETRVVITDDNGAITTLNIVVEPDINFIRDAVTRQFPRANIVITPGPDRTLIVGGTVESPEDIEPITRFLEGYAGAGRVSNNMRVVGVMQVQLEVCLAKVDRTELRRMGFNFLWADSQNYLASTIGGLVHPGTITPGGGLGTFTDTTFSEASNVLFGITDSSSMFLGFLEALKREGLSKIMANPVLVSYNGRPAEFLVGGEQPYPTPATLGQAPGVEFRPFGTRLRFLPVILGNGKIRLEVNPEVSRLDFSEPVEIAGTTLPRILIQRAQVTVELENGQSVAIGGLIQNETDAVTSKVPVLGELPFAGLLFRRIEHRERETELVVLVTARLIDPLDAMQRPKHLPGMETRTPTDCELFLEGILEAPRGPRSFCVDGCYRPAHHWLNSNVGHCDTSAFPAPSTVPAPTPAKGEVAKPLGLHRPLPSPPAQRTRPAEQGIVAPPRTGSRNTSQPAEAVPVSHVQTVPVELPPIEAPPLPLLGPAAPRTDR